MKLSFKFLVLAFAVSFNVISLRCMESGMDQSEKYNTGEWPFASELQNLVDVGQSLITQIKKLNLSCCECCLPDEPLEPAEESVSLLVEKDQHESCEITNCSNPLIRNKDIEILAQDIDCTTSTTLFHSIKDLTQKEIYDQALIVNAVQCALKNSGKSILMQGDYGYSVLHWACVYWTETCIKVILAVADSIDDEKATLQKLLVMPCHIGGTALDLACFANMAFEVRAILAAAETINDEGATLRILLEMRLKRNVSVCLACKTACAQALLDAARSIKLDIFKGIHLDSICFHCINADALVKIYHELELPVPRAVVSRCSSSCG